MIVKFEYIITEIWKYLYLSIGINIHYLYPRAGLERNVSNNIHQVYIAIFCYEGSDYEKTELLLFLCCHCDKYKLLCRCNSHVIQFVL